MTAFWELVCNWRRRALTLVLFLPQDLNMNRQRPDIKGVRMTSMVMIELHLYKAAEMQM